MRLIDADKFEKELANVWYWLVARYKKGYITTTHGEMLDKVHDILINQPTAYDLDRVVEIIESTEKSLKKSTSYRIKLEEEAIGYEMLRTIIKGDVERIRLIDL